MAVGVTGFPQTIDTATELLRAANLASSAIGVGGVNATATTVPVTDTSLFPVDGVAWVGTEAISYTGKTSTSLTGCVRGFDNSPAATHAAGDPIYADIITSAHHEVLRDAIISIQTLLGTRANAATTGVLRLDNNQWITARDQTNAVDVNLMKLGTGNAIEIGPTLETAITAGSVAGLHGWFNIGAATPQNEGGIWAGATRLGFVFTRKDTTGGGVAPTAPLTAHLDQQNAGSDGVALLTIGVAGVNNSAVWGANTIARSEVVTNAKLVGLEVDVEPAAGSTVDPASGGIFLNCFSIDGCGPAMLIGGLSGGKWTNGIIIDQISATGTGFAVQSGAPTMASAINTTLGTYGTAGAIFGAVNNAPSVAVRQTTVGSPTASIFLVQNSGGTVNFLNVDASGNTTFTAAASTDLAVVFNTTTAARTAQFILNDAGANKWYIRKPSDNTFDIYGAAAGAAALTISTTNLVNVPIFRAILAAGSATAGTAPLKYTSGTVLTTAEAGAHEFDGANWFETANTTNGRAQNVDQHHYRLAFDSSALASASIADYYPANSSLPTVAGAVYEIIHYLYFTKTTAGTVVFTHTSTTAPTRQKIDYVMTPVGGVGTVGTPQTAAVKGTTATALATPASGSLTTAVDHRAIVRILFVANTAGNVRLRITPSAGTVTPLADSYYVARRLPGNTGIFAT